MRSHTHPETLQLIVVLKLKKNLWSSESIIQEILDLQQESQQEEESDEDEDEEESDEDEEESDEDDD